MDEVIKNLCNSLIKEAKAVISYIDTISSTTKVGGMEAEVVSLASNMLDNVMHIQSLTVELSDNVSKVIPFVETDGD